MALTAIAIALYRVAQQLTKRVDLPCPTWARDVAEIFLQKLVAACGLVHHLHVERGRFVVLLQAQWGAGHGGGGGVRRKGRTHVFLTCSSAHSLDHRAHAWEGMWAGSVALKSQACQLSWEGKDAAWGYKRREEWGGLPCTIRR